MTHVSRPIDALHAADASVRLRAAMSAGTRPEDRDVPVLLARCAVEPDFFVRDMLTWALTRHPVSHTLPLLVAELGSPHAQARSQALHTLSKLKEAGAWPAVSDFLHDPDDEVARAAWRAAVVLAPRGARAELVAELVRELGRGDRDVQLSLSRALLALSDGTPAVDHASGAAGAAADTVAGMLAEAQGHPEARVRAHAVATQRLLADPDAEFGAALDEATRVAIDRAAPAVR
ncbi:MAG TPA: HEAT repeat domain-containing protein [Actinomycetaceae bacterium]|nr:HEAT repeat domain-containing protein [Actinomycetaceae bacterium]